MCHCGFCFSSAFTECFLSSLLVSVHPLCICTKPNNRTSVCFLRLSLASYLSFSLQWDSETGLTFTRRQLTDCVDEALEGRARDGMWCLWWGVRAVRKALCGRWCIGSVFSTKRVEEGAWELRNSWVYTLFCLVCVSLTQWFPNSAIPWNCLWIVEPTAGESVTVPCRLVCECLSVRVALSSCDHENSIVQWSSSAAHCAAGHSRLVF